jgi:hypothetical protein
MSQIDDAAHEGTPSPSTDEVSECFSVSAASSSPQLQRCHAAFLRDLPSLLAQHAGEWAAYVGNQQLGIGPSKRELYRQCIAAGHHDDEILICGIEQPRENVLDELIEV